MTVALLLRSDFESAVEAARDVGGAGDALPDLAARLSDRLAMRVADVWDRIEAALRTGYEYGREKAEHLVAQARSEAEDLLAEAGHQAFEVHQAMLAYMSRFLSRLVDAALGRIRPVIVVAGVEWRLQAVELNETVALSGSLSASIANLAQLTTSGELAVHASYAVGDPS